MPRRGPRIPSAPALWVLASCSLAGVLPRSTSVQNADFVRAVRSSLSLSLCLPFRSLPSPGLWLSCLWTVSDPPSPTASPSSIPAPNHLHQKLGNWIEVKQSSVLLRSESQGRAADLTGRPGLPSLAPAALGGEVAAPHTRMPSFPCQPRVPPLRARGAGWVGAVRISARGSPSTRTRRLHSTPER